MADPYVYIGENAVYWTPETKTGLEYLQSLGVEEAVAIFDKAYNHGPTKFSDGHERYFLLSWESGKSYRISLEE